MKSETIRCLELVENALDPAHLARTRQLWEDCRHYRPIPHLPTIVCCNPFQGQFYDPVEMHRACRDAGVMIWQWTTGLTPPQREVIRTGFTCFQWAADVKGSEAG